MKIETKAVHAGDRKKPASSIPVATPIYASSTFLYESTAQLDRVMGREEEGYSYGRYDNPTNVALEELMTALENGHGALACSSGMNAMHTARSEEHTSELQSPDHLVCRLLLEKKK